MKSYCFEWFSSLIQEILQWDECNSSVQSDIHIKKFYLFIFIFCLQLQVHLIFFFFTHMHTNMFVIFSVCHWKYSFLSLLHNFSTIIRSVCVTHYLWRIISIFSAYQFKIFNLRGAIFIKLIIYSTVTSALQLLEKAVL